jgi:hypothetical protein
MCSVKFKAIWMTVILAAPWSVHALAETRHERIALMLQGGSCRDHREEIARSLRPVRGVVAIHFDLVPDLVMVDVEVGAVSPAELEQALADAKSSYWQCTARQIESCISTGPMQHAHE